MKNIWDTVLTSRSDINDSCLAYQCNDLLVILFAQIDEMQEYAC